MFSGCTNLTEIILGNNIKEIKSRAFENCTSLVSIVLPNALEIIPNNAFAGCTSLANIKIPSSVKTLDGSTFNGCTSLTEIVVPNSVTTIENADFSGCINLNKITIGKSVSKIGNLTFFGCTNLNTVICYAETPPTITNLSFNGENRHATLYVPSNTKDIYAATNYWNGFKEIVEMVTPEYEDGDVFVAETEEGIELRYTVISTEDKTCMLGVTEPVEGEWDLTAYNGNKDGINHHTDKDAFTLTIPEEVNGFTVVSIGESALQWAPTLKSVSIPSTVREIGQLAFNNTGISELTIPASVERMGYQAYISSNLQSITVEEGNRVYDSRNNCNAIIETASNTLVVGCDNTIIVDGIEAIGEYSMVSAQNMQELHLPSSVVTIINPGFPGLREITVDEENPVFDSRDNCNAVIETASNTLILGCITTVIPESVVAIGHQAYSIETERMVIPGNVKIIGNQAFYNSVIEEVIIEDGVEYIGEQAFCNNGYPINITIPSTVVGFGSRAFFLYSMGTVTSYITDPFDAGDAFGNFGTWQTLYVPYGTKAKYEAAGGWGVFDNIVEMDCDLIVMQKAMQTYTSSYALDFSTPVEGLKAYTVTAVNEGGKAVLTEVTGAVPAGTGLVLMGTAGEQYAVPCVAGAVGSDGNLLVGVTADTAIGGNDTDYILKDGKFVKAVAGTLPAGKAYLKIEGSQAREFIEIEGVTTGIGNAVWAAGSGSKVYTLGGQRVSQPQRKGLYIVNGKKVIK